MTAGSGSVAEKPGSLARRQRRIGPSGEGVPLLIAVVGLHGNEPAGVHGADRVLRALEADARGLVGELVVITGNLGALAAGRRYLREDLNRVWTEERVARVRSSPAPGEAEEGEMRDVDRLLEELIERGPERPRYLMDVHTFSSPGPAFGLLDDSLANRDFASQLGVPLILGLEEEVSGTLLDYLAPLPVTTVGFESGRHDEPEAVDRAEAGIWVALESSGVLERAVRPEVEAGRRLLAHGAEGLGPLYDVRYRYPIEEEQGFRMREGFVGFQKVRRGEVLADDRRGAVAAREEAQILMPLYQRQGEDGFFLVSPVHEIWLTVSRLLRRLRFDRRLHLLPGVERIVGDDGALRINRRVARWLALELMHLLGYRRQEQDGDHVVMRRRDPERG